MKFKSPEMEAELEGAHALLQEIAEEFEKVSLLMKIEPVVTRVRGKVKGESGVHTVGRAIDFRNQHAGTRLYTDKEVEAITVAMNSKYHRNDGKKTCIHHKFDGGPAHFHLQVAPLMSAYNKKRN